MRYLVTTTLNDTYHAHEDNYPVSEQFGAFAVLMIFGTFGGFVFALWKGMTFPPILCLPKFTVPALLKNIVIPPLIGMIIFACIAINFFGPLMEAFPFKWTSYMKYVCHCTLLIRAGLQIEFRGRLLTVLLLLIPQHFEATLGAWLSWYFFEMPVSVAYATGYVIASVSPSVTVPALI